MLGKIIVQIVEYQLVSTMLVEIALDQWQNQIGYLYTHKDSENY